MPTFIKLSLALKLFNNRALAIARDKNLFWLFFSRREKFLSPDAARKGQSKVFKII